MRHSEILGLFTCPSPLHLSLGALKEGSFLAQHPKSRSRVI